MTLRVTRRPKHGKSTRPRLRAVPVESVAEPAPEVEPVEVEPPAPEPPERVHQFGSQYLVTQPFDELMRQRGYSAEALQYRRSLTPTPREDAAQRAGFTQVLWPTE